MDIRKAIQKVVYREDLTQGEAHQVFGGIMSGKATSSQIGAFITALRMKGETVDEITGATRVMREKSLKIRTRGIVLDTCGTGGSGLHTFNISTASAFVLAGCGVKVAKHGNRSASSRCGSADVLEELGVRLDVPAKVTEKCLKEINIGFMFAPLFHSAMKYAVKPRREIGIRTIFNILGPLSNPASANCQVLGVFKDELTGMMARVLKELGTRRAYIVHGSDGLDEVTIAGKTNVSELKGGKVKSFYVTPGTFGVKKASIKDIRGGSVKQNAKILRDVLSGKKGPKRDVVLINVSVGLMASGRVKNFREGVKMAAHSIDSGRALEKLQQLVKITNRGAK
ncbi:MAG: anthranilate phosphoribosyltransferase [Candidatus Omnitrophota bacterium]